MFAKKKNGFLGKLFGGGKEEEYDLDAIAFLLDSNGKSCKPWKNSFNANNGRQVSLYGGDVHHKFFNSMKHPGTGHIWLTGDNRTGAGDGDDEQIIVKLDSLDEKNQKILFVVSIYQGRQNNQHFSMVENAFIRAVDAKGKEITKYSLSNDSTLNGMCSMVFAEAYRKDGGWKFRAIGEPHQTDNFVEILKKYTYN
jgi:tellurium resistance protein TerD